MVYIFTVFYKAQLIEQGRILKQNYPESLKRLNNCISNVPEAFKRPQLPYYKGIDESH